MPNGPPESFTNSPKLTTNSPIVYEAATTIASHLHSQHNFSKSAMIDCPDSWEYKRYMDQSLQFLITMLLKRELLKEIQKEHRLYSQ